MDGYLCRMGHHFIVAIHESRAKIYDDVHYESDVDWNIKHFVKNNNSIYKTIVNILSLDLESVKIFFESKWTRNKAKVERYKTSYYFAQIFDDNFSQNLVQGSTFFPIFLLI